MTAAPDIKTAAALEKRVWVRLTRRCNNGCLFCLDSDSHDGLSVDRTEIEAQIRRGRDEGGQRLILSGGEPTIHPDYLHFLSFGTSLGYPWLQTITNGRMFAYPKLAQQALAAGLREVTFSMHGHTPELHDRLVGVPGAFAQSLRGLRNMLGRAVVSVDVVLNRLNLPLLHDILHFYISLGVTEFDLLHMVPFGRAWNQHRDLLFYDLAEMAPHLRKAFALRGRKGIVLWTNRLPAPFLEGAEDLIQDPHKLHDEVRGRLDMFSAWRDRGEEPICCDDRCPHCAMSLFCSVLRRTLATLARTPTEHLHDPVQPLPGLPPCCLHDRGETEHPGSSVRGGRVEGTAPETEGRIDIPAILGDDYRLDFVRFTDHFIQRHYFVKSLRCRACIHDPRCRGIHIDTARTRGFGILTPIRGGEHG